MSKGTRRRHAQKAHEPVEATASDDQGRAGHRHGRLEQIFQEELMAILRDEITDPALEDVEFTSVVLSVDYKHARVRFVTSLDKRATSERALLRATPFFRARLADAVDLKQVPDLRFIFDRDAIHYSDEGEV